MISYIDSRISNLQKRGYMKLSTRIRYGTRALVCVAAFSEGRPLPLSEIAKREKISFKYLESIISSLKQAGLVESVRGAEGGYVLKKTLDQITLNEIVQALGGPISIIDCLGNQKECTNRDECALFEIWAELNDVIKEKLESIRLTEIVDRKKEKTKIAAKTEMYYI